MVTPTYGTGQGTANPLFGGSTGLSAKAPASVVQKFEFDLSKFTGATTNSLNLMDFPAFTQVDFIYAVVQTVLAAGNSIKIGDSAAIDTYVTADSVLTAGHVYTIAVTTNPLKTYATADNLNISITNAALPTTGVIRFVVGTTDLTRNAPMSTQS